MNIFIHTSLEAIAIGLALFALLLWCGVATGSV